MSTNPLNQTAYLRTSREFPEDSKILSVELTKAYIDIANAINCRTIGIFAPNRPAITGEEFFLVNNRKQQTLRQVYTFTAAGNIAHGIVGLQAGQITKPSGSYTDGTNNFGVIFGSSVAIAGQVSFYVTSTNIVVVSGAGAPAIVSGRIILEWLSLP